MFVCNVLMHFRCDMASNKRIRDKKGECLFNKAWLDEPDFPVCVMRKTSKVRRKQRKENAGSVGMRSRYPQLPQRSRDWTMKPSIYWTLLTRRGSKQKRACFKVMADSNALRMSAKDKKEQAEVARHELIELKNKFN